jgi:hypothetical protein
MEARLNKLELDRATDAEKIRTLYAANKTVCEELTKATIAMNEVKTQIAVLIATLPTTAEREDIENRITAIELEHAKAKGGFRVGTAAICAVCTLIGFLIANADKIAQILK